MNSSFALGLLAAATLVGDTSGRSKLRLAVMHDRPKPARRGRWAESRLTMPIVSATSVGALVGVLCGWPSGLPVGALTAVVVWLGARRLLGKRTNTNTANDQLALAAGWDLLAACLRSGMPVPTAVLAVADYLPHKIATTLHTTADLLALGADPVSAWEPALADPATAELARGARRTARSGTALAGVAAGLAKGIRQRAGDVAEARAQRAGVLITGPLGLCFLPAFVCLGIVPVIAGLTAQLSTHM